MEQVEKTSVKRNSLFYLISIISLWLFPPLAFFLFTTKKGSETISEKFKLGFKKMKDKVSALEIKRDGKFWLLMLLCPYLLFFLYSKKGDKSLFAKIKELEVKKDIWLILFSIPFGFWIFLLFSKKGEQSIIQKIFFLRIFKSKLFLITTLLCFTCVILSSIRQSQFNKPFIDKILSNSTLDVEFIEDKHLTTPNNIVSLKFDLRNGELTNYIDRGGKVGSTNNYAAIWLYLNSQYQIVLDDVVQFVKLTNTNYVGFSFTFRSPDYKSKHYTREIYYDMYYELEVKLKGSDNNRYGLGFWSFIPNLYKPNIPKMNSDGSIDAQITERMYKKIKDLQNGYEARRSGNEVTKYKGKVFISPSNIFELGNNLQTNLIENKENVDSIKTEENKDKSEENISTESIINDEPSFAGDFMGNWYGTVGDKEILIMLNSVTGDTLEGYAVVNENKFSLKGLATSNENNFTITLSGNDGSKGVFELNVVFENEANYVATGQWNPNNGNTPQSVILKMK